MKKRIHFIAIISFLTLIIISPEMIAQSNAKKLNYSKHPYWIEMMNDPKANYFETIKAYEQFWQNKKLPLEEDDVIGQTKKEPTKKSFLSKWFKSFKHWKLKVMPFVQEDGSILDADERLKLWQNQQH